VELKVILQWQPCLQITCAYLEKFGLIVVIMSGNWKLYSIIPIDLLEFCICSGVHWYFNILKIKIDNVNSVTVTPY